ncbi:hypothetical protein VTK56DRAFT_9357 [Thermocarpiscus australiensis]
MDPPLSWTLAAWAEQHAPIGLPAGTFHKGRTDNPQSDNPQGARESSATALRRIVSSRGQEGRSVARRPSTYGLLQKQASMRWVIAITSGCAAACTSYRTHRTTPVLEPGFQGPARPRMISSSPSSRG